MKLEAGKRYVRRDGEITAPLEPYDGLHLKWIDRELDLTWRDDGKWDTTDRCHQLDLLRECVEEGDQPMMRDEQLNARMMQLATIAAGVAAGAGSNESADAIASMAESIWVRLSTLEWQMRQNELKLQAEREARDDK